MLSPGLAGRETDGGGARRHVFPWTGSHPQSQCEECWVDVEASRPSRRGDGGGGGGYEEGGGQAPRRAVMRAPGRGDGDGGNDGVVVETVVQVSRAENYF